MLTQGDSLLRPTHWKFMKTLTWSFNDGSDGDECIPVDTPEERVFPKDRTKSWMSIHKVRIGMPSLIDNSQTVWKPSAILRPFYHHTAIENTPRYTRARWWIFPRSWWITTGQRYDFAGWSGQRHEGSTRVLCQWEVVGPESVQGGSYSSYLSVTSVRSNAVTWCSTTLASYNQHQL
jgi:hypothetical protein